MYPSTRKGDLGPVRGKSRFKTISVTSEVGLVAAVRVHLIDLRVAFTVAHKPNPFSIRGKCGRFIGRVVVGKVGLLGTVSVHHINIEFAIPITRERDLFSVWREGGPV